MWHQQKLPNEECPVPCLWRRLWHEACGLTTVEYALLLCFVSLAVMGSLTDLGCSVRRVANSAGRSLLAR